MCNNCENLYSKLFNNHHTYKSDKDINEIFTEFVRKKNIMNNQNFFVKLIIHYVVHHVYVKLKRREKVNINIVMSLLLKKYKKKRKKN